MAILYKLVFLTACPSTHHKLAMDALRHLRCPESDRWRNLFLNYYEPYLQGAKAPDAEFKDFQNHVLHVRENYWGGAIRTSQLWYERVVKALRREYWADAVYAAGVLSHYVTDPMMPFHTGQTEEEGKVHRAAEWSITKCYEEFQNILERDLGGYPTVSVSHESNWLEQLIKQGAELANSHYQPLLDHYDLAAGVADPPSGLDQECKDRVAQMIGFAAVALARVLEKAFVEAGSAPPMCELVRETIMASMKMPARWLLQRMDDEDEREELEDLLEEAERTGKVVENLRDDDKFVRKLHAHQVLKVSLKELDAQPAKATGLHHGTGKPDRQREPGFLSRWFGWDFKLIDWDEDDRPNFVPPIPIRKQGVGLGKTAAAARVPTHSTRRRRGSSGRAKVTLHEAARGSGMAGTVDEPETLVAVDESPRDEQLPREPMRRERNRSAPPPRVAARINAARNDEYSTDESPLERSANERSANRGSTTRTDGEERGERASLAPPAKRSWFGWRRSKSPQDDASASSDDDSPATRPGSSPDNESSASDEPGTSGVSRGARFKQTISGVASRVWTGTATAASKVKQFVPRFKRSPKGAADERDGDLSATADRQGLLADDGAGEELARNNDRKPNSRATRDERSSARAPGLRFHLQGDSPVEDAPSIGAKMARRLEAQGIRVISDLLEADPDHVAARLGQKQIDGDVIRQWQVQADLMLRIPEVRGHDVQILVACGISDPAEIAGLDPASLFELIEPFLGTREAESILRGSPPPDLNEVADWIDWAQHARPRQAA